MVQTIQQFGASIKQKYPQYKDMSDENVGMRVVAKYPQYKNQISMGGNDPSQPSTPKSFMDKVGGVAQGITNFIGAKGISDQFGASLAKASLPKDQRQYVQEPGLKNVLGSAIQTGSLLIPGAGVGAGLAKKVGVGALTGYGLDVGSKLQNNQSVSQSLTPGVGTAVGAALPGIGAVGGYASRVVGRLFKGLGSGLSGVSTKTIDQIINNPQVAQKAAERLTTNGNYKVLEENAKQIVNGMSKVRQEARNAYGQGLEKLSATDINPSTFREQTQSVLDKYGVTGGKNSRQLTGVEFDSPKLVKKASELINKLSTAELNGKSLRKLSNDFESAAFKTTGSDAERLSFNAFVKDLSGSLQNAVTKSTSKLNEINQSFSKDMQMVETMQNAFGKVNFKNLPEVVKASQKLEGLFNQKGILPEEVDKFLQRIGAPNLKTTEAVRQIANKEPMPPNTPGFNIGELFRTATESLMTPETVGQISIKTGLAKEKLTPFLNGLKSLSPYFQRILIESLLKSQPQTEGQTPQ